MGNTRYVNDVSHLFDEEVKTDRKGDFICPVCEKKYATRAGIHKHMEKRDCASAQKLFEGTITEEIAYDLFFTTVGQFNPNQRLNHSSFKKSKVYKPLLRFILHCMNNKTDPDMFYLWIVNSKNPKYYNQVFSYGLKDSVLVEFRKHLIKNQELISSEEFFERNEHRLLSDRFFLIRSLERGDIGLDFCLESNTIDLGSMTNDLPEPLKIRLLQVVEVAES